MSIGTHFCSDPFGLCEGCDEEPLAPTPLTGDDYNNRYIRKQRFAMDWAREMGWTWRVKR